MLPIMMIQVWVHEQADGKLDIVDGKQRITSLLSYLDGIFPRNQQRFALEASQPPECTRIASDDNEEVNMILTVLVNCVSTFGDRLRSMEQALEGISK